MYHRARLQGQLPSEVSGAVKQQEAGAFCDVGSVGAGAQVQRDGEEAAAELAPEAQQAPEYRRLITIPGGRLRGATLIEGLRDQEFVRRISLSETQINSAAKAFPQALVRWVLPGTLPPPALLAAGHPCQHVDEGGRSLPPEVGSEAAP